MSSTNPGMRCAVLAVITAVLSALLLPATAAWATPTPTTLELDADADTNGTVVMSGSLVDVSGHGVANAQLTVTGGGRALHSAVTDGSGGFTMRFRLPSDMLEADQEVSVTFAGNAQYGPSSTVRLFQFSQLPQQQAGATTMTMEVSSDNTYPGGMLQVSGRVTTDDGGAVASATVTFAYEGTSLPNSSTVTDQDGSYSAMVEIPAQSAEGKGSLVATFAGGGSLQSSSAVAELTVASPVRSSPTPSATAEGAMPETAPASMTDSSGPSAASSKSQAEPVAATPESGNFPTMWFLAAAVIVVAIGALTLLGVVARPRNRDIDDDELIGLIGDAEDEDMAQRLGASPEAPSAMLSAAGRQASEPPVAFTSGQPEAPRRGGGDVPEGWFREGTQDTVRPHSETQDWDDFSETETTKIRQQEPRARRRL